VRPENDSLEDPGDVSGATSTRRSFLVRMGIGAAASVTAAVGGLPLARPEEAEAREPRANDSRRFAAFDMRKQCARLAYDRDRARHPNNDEERDYPYVASFCKGLPHDRLGEVDPQAYAALRNAIRSGNPADFELVPMAGIRKLTNPLAGMAFELQGADSHGLTMRPHPRIDAPECSSEMAELYWQTIARDVPFSDYDTNEATLAAAADLSAFSDFRGPKTNGRVTPETLFRMGNPGSVAGPYVSQFLLRDVTYGSLTISQRQKTLVPGTEFVTAYPEWLSVQRGEVSYANETFDQTRRYIRSGRDLAAYVHRDALYEAYLNACLMLFDLHAPLNRRNPYRRSRSMDGFGTFGAPHIQTLVTEVATRALKAVWFQKWFVHRRLRPEEFGGRIHNHVTGEASYPIDHEVLDSAALDRTYSQFGTYLLPQAFPEGSPLHPAYGSGHSTVAGACVTILKAFFDESWVLPEPVVASADGTELVPYDGELTVGGELEKVAVKVALGRDFAGIHWRTDGSEALKLGEEIAITVLQDQKPCYAEKVSFRFTKFDGTVITI
jgi:hypothetical protein